MKNYPSYQKEYRAKKWAAYYIANRESVLARKKQSRKNKRVADPIGVSRKFREQSLKKNGWSSEAYESALKAQNGQCAICKTPLTKDIKATGAAADHCHVTGVRREILCMLCNKGIGNFKDDPAKLIAASEYLKKHQYKRILRVAQ